MISVPVGPDTVRGSRRVPCAECGVVLGVAPSSWHLLDEQDATVMCAKCALPKIKADPDPKFQAPSPAQIAEVLAHLGHERRN